MDRTWVVTASKNIVAEGVEIVAGDRVAAITSSVPPQTLFGLMQYHGFTVEEIPVDSSRIDDPEDINAVEVGESTEAVSEQVFDNESPAALADEPETKQAEPVQPVDPIAELIADGLDEKTAKAVVEQNKIGKVDLLKLIDEGFDLTDLDGIGEERAKKILAVYKP